MLCAFSEINLPYNIYDESITLVSLRVWGNALEFSFHTHVGRMIYTRYMAAFLHSNHLSNFNLGYTDQSPYLGTRKILLHT